MRYAALLVAFMMLIVLAPSSPHIAVPVAATTYVPGNCPASSTLRISLAGGTPNSLTFLTAAVNPAFYLSSMLWTSLYPPFSPTGSQLYNLSIADWISHNNNYTEWTINIRPGLKWSNGQPVTSNDILATYSSKFAFNSTFDFTGAHNEVKSETASNTSEVVFLLNQPDAHFLETISTLVLTNVLPASEAMWNFTGIGVTPIVDGPFYPVNYTAGSTQMVAYTNPYFNTTGLPEPQFCQVDMSFAETDSELLSYVLSGSTDIAYSVDPADVQSILNNPNWHLIDQHNTAPISINWNVTTYPLNMTAFRQAMVYGVNQSQIVAQALSGYGGTAYAAEGTVPPNVAQYYNPNQTTYSYNTTKALSLLQSIGITQSGGKLQYANGNPVSFTLYVDDSSTQDILAAGVIQNDLQSLGMQVSLDLVSHSTLSSFTSVAPDSMYLSTGFGAVFADPAIDAQPGWNVYLHPAIPNSYWEYPPSANAEYQSNSSAIAQTDDPAQMANYLDNIQALNAKYLPTFIVSYFDTLAVYNTQRWTNWPGANSSSGWFNENAITNLQLLAQLQPTSTSTTATSTSTTATSTSTTATSTSGSGNNTLTYAALAAIVVVVVGAGLFFSRRSAKRPNTNPPT